MNRTGIRSMMILEIQKRNSRNFKCPIPVGKIMAKLQQSFDDVAILLPVDKLF